MDKYKEVVSLQNYGIKKLRKKYKEDSKYTAPVFEIQENNLCLLKTSASRQEVWLDTFQTEFNKTKLKP